MVLVYFFCYLHNPFLGDAQDVCSTERPKYSIPKRIANPRGKEITRLVAGNGLCTSAISLLCDGKLDTLALGQRDPRLLRPDDEDVTLTRGERVVYGILDVDNVEASIVALTVGDDTNTAHVTTTSRHGNDASIELDEVCDLASGEINLDSVIDLDAGVWVSDTTRNLVSTSRFRNTNR
jgi:hypothetical protein